MLGAHPAPLGDPDRDPAPFRGGQDRTLLLDQHRTGPPRPNAHRGRRLAYPNGPVDRASRLPTTRSPRLLLLLLGAPAPTTSVRESKVTVKIPRPLYRRIQQVVEGSGFNSPTDFIVYVLRDLMGETDADQPKEFTQEELDDVKRKLRNLGYL